MKVNTILSALFLASVATAVMPDDPAKIDTCQRAGELALTFDDGPGIYNDQLLGILAKHNVKATFFMIGEMVAQSPAQAASLKKILAAGHQLASHTYTHSNLDAMTEEQMKSEITRTSDIMFQNSGIRPAYMRAPEGRCSALCTKVMTEMGLVISHWNVDTNDWRFKSLSAAEATEKSMVEVNKVIIQDSNPATDSFILLQHEIHKFSVESLADRVISAILTKGYKFVTMEECVGKPAYLSGSTVPPVTSTTPGVPGASTTGGPAVPTGTVAPSSGSGAVPSGSTTAAPSAQTTVNKNNGAGLVKAGAWAMGVAVAVAYAMI
ncbi:hypothetical protein BGZ76_002295 [Entomortierella beljakovae]|nr:hypothetical protein BGZ76_002295 [Entomortierella beljakovae]